MPDKPPRTDLLGLEVHTASVWMMVAVLLATWFLSHVLSRRIATTRPAKLIGFAVRTVIGTAGIWAFWQAVARHLVLETTWPLWTGAFIGALAIEILTGLYQWEKKIVRPGLGRWLLALRLLLTAAVLTMLAQPVFARNETRRVDRNVVVLVDDSASMQIADKDMPVEEKLALAAFEGIEVMKERPELPALFTTGRALAQELESKADTLKFADDLTNDEQRTLIDAQKDELLKLEAAGREWSDALRKAMEESRRGQSGLPADVQRLRDDVRRRFSREFIDLLNLAKRGINDRNVRQLRRGFSAAADEAQRAIDLAGPYADAVDAKFYSGLPEDARKKIDAGTARTRAQLATEILTRRRNDQPSFLDKIKAKYTLRTMRFGRKAAETDGFETPAADDPAMRNRSDLTAALTKIKETYPSDNLAGVVVVSDFRHNGPLPPDDVARGLGGQGSPVCAVVTGSTRGTKDAAIIGLTSPQTIFLGDRVRMKADIKADGLRGKQLTVKLLKDGGVLHTEKLNVPEDSFRTTVRLGDQPADKGIFGYSVRLDPLEGELFPDNNEWKTDVAVSDDRTNVLLIDDRPRWEFRYLRNLFDSRDKSVHLQYVLIHPDTLAGADPPPDIPASAARKFGDSEATRMPSTAAEWRKFDVIILGDLPPGVLGDDSWKVIRECVDQRGAMLVMIAGPNAMPHAYSSAAAQSLMPVEYDVSPAPVRSGPEAAFRLQLTSEGRQSIIFLQSLSGVQNAQIWNEIPVLRWRHAVRGVKTGAQVLAWARPVPVDSLGHEIETGAGAGVMDFMKEKDPARQLSAMRETERRHALVVTSQIGLGKVVMLTTDQTWRFRYGVGDTYHHRFWGQLMRWGAGQNLAAGTSMVRLGTDKLSAEPGEEIRIMARLVDEEHRPLAGAGVSANLYRDGERVLRLPLKYQANSHGMYEATVQSLTEPGVYRVELAGDEVDRLLAKDNVRIVEQKLTIAAEGNPVELGEISVDKELAARVASLGGGKVAGMAEVDKLIDLFGPATKEVEERKETRLWDNWIILALAVGAATAEWILRRRGGLV